MSFKILLRGREGVFKYCSGFSGSGEVYLNTCRVPEKYMYFPIIIYLYDTSPPPKKPGMYLKTPFRRRRSIYAHFYGAGEVRVYTYLALEKPEKPEKSDKSEKYLYAPDA